jgi:hypothetical protein
MIYLFNCQDNGLENIQLQLLTLHLYSNQEAAVGRSAVSGWQFAGSKCDDIILALWACAIEGFWMLSKVASDLILNLIENGVSDRHSINPFLM